ncbi:unnamed protein product [Camellia sinensis]
MFRIKTHNRRASRMGRETAKRRGENLSQNVLKNLAAYGYPARRSGWFRHGGAAVEWWSECWRWRWCSVGLGQCSHLDIAAKGSGALELFLEGRMVI